MDYIRTLLEQQPLVALFLTIAIGYLIGEITGSITNDAIDQAVEIISERVNGAGVAEAEVTAQGNGANAVIVVAVPGLTEDKLIAQLGQTAKLGFRPVVDAQPNTPPTPAHRPKDGETGWRRREWRYLWQLGRSDALRTITQLSAISGSFVHLVSFLWSPLPLIGPRVAFEHSFSRA